MDEKALGPLDNVANGGGGGQRGDRGVDIYSRRRWRGSPGGTFGQKWLGRFAVEVVNDQLVTGLDEIGGQRGANVAETNEAYAKSSQFFLPRPA